MAGYNRVFMLGNLTFDPELRELRGGRAAATLGLAVNRRVATAEGDQRQEVCFIDANVYGRLAEVCCEYLGTGSQVLVEGFLTFHQWETERGEKRSKHRILAQSVQFLGSPADREDDAGPDWKSGGFTFKIGGGPAGTSDEADDHAPDDDAPLEC